MKKTSLPKKAVKETSVVGAAINAEGIRLIVPPGHFKKGVKEKRSRKKGRTSRRNGKAPCGPGKKRGRPRNWTDAQRLRIIKRIDEGKETAVEIGRREGIHPSMISRWRKGFADKNG